MWLLHWGLCLSGLVSAPYRINGAEGPIRAPVLAIRHGNTNILCLRRKNNNNNDNRYAVVVSACSHWSRNNKIAPIVPLVPPGFVVIRQWASQALSAAHPGDH